MCKDTAPAKDTLATKRVHAAKEPVLAPEKLWLVHGEYYDLTEFIHRHPGGVMALATAKGQDCTTLFEQYHVMNDKHLRTLAKYHVGGDSDVKKVVTEDAFHRDVKEMVREYANGRRLRMSTTFTVLCSISLVGLCFSLYLYYHLHPLSLVLLPICSWLLAVNTAHDGCHFATTSYPWLNNVLARTATLLFFNPTFWYIQHNVSHHTHTNEPDMDIDLTHGLPFVKMHANQSVTNNIASTVFNGVTMFMVACRYLTVIFPLAILFKMEHTWPFSPAQIQFFEDNWYTMFAEVSVTIAFSLYPFFYAPILKALAFALIPSAIASLVFMVITQVSHIQYDAQPEVFKDQHWSRTQVDTTVDYSQDSLFWGFVTGGLNTQVMHHIIPGVSSSHYSFLYPAFRKVCEKHGLKIRERPNLWVALVTMLKTMVDFAIADMKKAAASADIKKVAASASASAARQTVHG